MGEIQETQALVISEPRHIAPWTPRFALTVDEAVELVEQKREFMRRVMREGEHFGTIPGTPKPTLYKPGAELLLSTMSLHSDSSINTVPPVMDLLGTEHGGEAFVQFQKTCEIYREEIAGERILIARASANCSTWEKKYRYRKADRSCPTCGKTGTIIKGKAEFGGGWLCWKKKGGCDAKFTDTDKRITDQLAADIPNPDIADLINTVEKIAAKRALVAATLLATGCSDIFTQDLEDGVGSADDRGPAVDENGEIAKPSKASADALKGAQSGHSAPPSSGPTPKPVGRDRSAVEAGAPSVGPRAKRGNVVQAPQGAATERSSEEMGERNRESGQGAPKTSLDVDASKATAVAPPETLATAPAVRGGFSYRDHGKKALLANAPRPNEPEGPTPLADEIAKMQAKVEELKAKARARDHVAEDGKTEYLATLREGIRESAAVLRQLRVRMKNAEGGEPMPVPEAVPSSDSDESLAVFIANQYPGKTLPALNERELETVSKTLDDLIVRVKARLK